MQILNTPTATYDADYIESHGAETGYPERELWKAVLRQAGEDLFSSDEQIRADAMAFFQGPDLLRILDFAGISTSYALLLREQAKGICQQSGRSRRRRGITYRGETRTCREWALITGLTMDTITGRLRHGWPVAKALTAPLQKGGRRSLR